MMQYLVVFTPNEKFATEGRPTDFATKELEEQAEVRVQYARGNARQVWALESASRDQIRGGVILYEAESLAVLQALIDHFPLVAANYAQYEILPIAPHAAFQPRAKETETQGKNDPN